MKILNFIKKGKKNVGQDSEKYGLISNFLTQQMFRNEDEITEIHYDNYREIIKNNGLGTIILDNDIYEVDHSWFMKSIEKLISYAKVQNLKIIVIKNTAKPVQTSLSMYYRVEIDPLINEMTHIENGIKLPLLVDEHKINPIDAHKSVDVLYVNGTNQPEDNAITKFHTKFSPVFEEIVLEGVTREAMGLMVEKARNSKVIYIRKIEDIDKIFLKYFEIMGYLLNSYVTFDPGYEYEPEYGVRSESVQANVSKIRAIINNGLYKDKKVLPIQRKVFLNNSFLLQPSIPSLLENSYYQKRAEVSAIISTNRPANVDFVINQMNEQKNVTLQVVLVTHGFELRDEERKYIQDRINFELIIIKESETTSLGNCLNRAIDMVRYPVVTKIDDDDYYTQNYLIDQWIALKYSGADLVGKAAHFVYMEEEDVVIKREKDKYFNFDRFIMGATIMSETDYLKKYMFNDLPAAVDTDLLNRVRESNGRIYQGHPYELCVFRGSDKGKHTWKVEDRAMLSSAEVVCYGDPRPTIRMD